MESLQNFQSYKKDASNIIATNQTATIFYDPNEDYLNAIGKNPEMLFSFDQLTLSSETKIKAGQSEAQQISLSSSHVLVLYGGESVYASPDTKKELFGTWVDGKDYQFSKIKFQDTIGKIFKVLALNCGSLILCMDTNTKKREIYSYGIKNAAGLGQGIEANPEQYERLCYPAEIEFIDLTGYAHMAAAISSNKELYTWGKAYKGALGLYTPEGKIIEEVNTPTKVQGLENYNVISVSVSLTHMLVLVEEKKCPNNRKVIGFGDNAKGQLGDKNPNINKAEITFFNDKFPYLVSAGTHCSFGCCGAKKRGVIHDVKSSIDGKEIHDILYFQKFKANSYKYWSKKQISELPKIAFATRHPISKIEEKNWPLLEEFEFVNNEIGCVDCTLCSQKTKGPYYISAVKEVKQTLCETCFFKTPSTFTPVIYYRLSSALIQISKIPVLSLNDFYEILNDSVYLSLTPNYKLQFPEHALEKAFKIKLDEFLEESKHFTKENDLDIQELISDYLIEKKKNIDQFSLKNDIPIIYGKKAALVQFDEEALKRRSKVLIKMNKVIEKAIKQIDFESKSYSGDDLYACYTKVKEYVATKTKDGIVKEYFSTNVDGQGGNSEVKLDRHKGYSL